jgi:hypothetical protein
MTRGLAILGGRTLHVAMPATTTRERELLGDVDSGASSVQVGGHQQADLTTICNSTARPRLLTPEPRSAQTLACS